VNIFKMLERRRVEKEFERFVGPEVLSMLEKPPVTSLNATVEKKHFQFVLVNLDEENFDQIPARISKIVDTFRRYDATLSSITSSLVVAVLGVPFPKSDSVELRRQLVSAILTEHSKLIRIAHGQCDGFVGSLGPEGNRRYGEVIPGFAGILSTLLNSEFGTVTEFHD
jgi:hypothetical protein